MQTARELFLHELSDALDAEHRILEALSEQSQESSSTALRSAFEQHHKQTQGQIERLEQCFELIDQDAEQTECAGIKGLIEEHESFVAEDPAPDILDVFNIGAAIKVERYEISAYESLIRLAELMEQAGIVRLLKQNLREEEQTLKKMTTLSNSVKPEAVELEEEESDAEASAEENAEESASENSKPGPHIVKKSGPRKGRAA